MTLPLNLRLLALGFALVATTAVFGIPGYLTWDAGTYHLMVRTLYETGSFAIANGYEELSSPLLAVGQVTVKDGRLAAQYPEFYTILALPFYALFGYRGLMVLNAAAFVGICALIWRMAAWFSADRNAPLAAVAVYALATYAINFTQSSYPHLTSTFLICAAVWLLWGAALGKGELAAAAPWSWLRRGEGRCALAGLVFGIAVGVRLDSAFAGLALAVPLVTFRTLGWRALFACGLGGLAAMLGLAWINAAKFGVFLPFSYGREGSGGSTGSLSGYIPVAAVAALGMAIFAWHRVRPIRLNRWALAFLLTAVAVALISTSYGQRLIRGLFQIVVDMRIRPEIPEPGLSRSPGGAVVYWGHVKKSLLESCPYLILIVIPAVRGLASGTYGPRWLLWLVPAGFVGFYGYLAWHGSVGWSMRYLNPALPFLALLASHELLRVWAPIPVRRVLFWGAIVVLWAALVVAFLQVRSDLVRQEALILNGSLLLAALMLSCQAAEMWTSPGLSRIFRKALSGIFIIALVWSSALTLAVDFAVSAQVRTLFLRSAREIQPWIAKDALIMTFQPNFVWGLLDSGKRPIIANYMLGAPADSVALVERALRRRPVYWLSRLPDHDTMSPEVFAELAAKDVRTELVLDASPERYYRLFELRKEATIRP
jgi:hypothetical protein